MKKTQTESETVLKNSRDRPKKTKFIDATICKISGRDNVFLDQIIAHLAEGFRISPTSAKMFNDETQQFFQFIKVEPKEEV